jgi:hypothetical protein
VAGATDEGARVGAGAGAGVRWTGGAEARGGDGVTLGAEPAPLPALGAGCVVAAPVLPLPPEAEFGAPAS